MSPLSGSLPQISLAGWLVPFQHAHAVSRGIIRGALITVLWVIFFSLSLPTNTELLKLGILLLLLNSLYFFNEQHIV